MRVSDADSAWALVRATAGATEQLVNAGRAAAFTTTPESALRPVSDGDPAAIVRFDPAIGWTSLLSPDDPHAPLIDLYLPVCSGTRARPVTVGHLGQSLDGFIATHAGESRWVTGDENMRHMHRLRALCDAVIVGAATVAIDDPQLTTRLVPGDNALRVVLDPTRRLEPRHRVFTDDSAETLYVCGRSLVLPGETHFGCASVVGVSEGGDAGIDPMDVMRLLRDRGCARVFVEGGGVTVSMFLAANLLDRLHIAVAPLLIGDGRPAIRLPPRAALDDCHRPRYRVFRMGGDILFDCDLRAEDFGTKGPDARPPIARVL